MKVKVVDPQSIIQLPKENELPVFPKFKCDVNDPFLLRIHRSGKKWIIIVDEEGEPYVVLNANEFLRNALLASGRIYPYLYCHRPIIVKDYHILLGKVLCKFKVTSKSESDDVIDDDIILIWADEKKVITGSDVFGSVTAWYCCA